MKGIIILEGADGCGKTTLARELQSRFGGHYVHLRRHIDLFNWWFGAIAFARKRAKHELVVIDRHWPSHLIYQAVYDGKVPLDCITPTVIRLLKKLRATYIMCVPSSVEEVVARHAVLKEMRVEMYNDGMGQVAAAYRALWEGEMLAGPAALSKTFEAITAAGGMKTWANAVRYKVGITSYEDIITAVLNSQRSFPTLL